MVHGGPPPVDAGPVQASAMMPAAAPPATDQATSSGGGRPGLYAGFETVIARPFFGSNVALIPDNAPRQFDFNYQFSPRVVLGLCGQGGGGLRARYWQFDHEGQTITGSDSFDAEYHLHESLLVETADLELTQLFIGERFVANGFLGLRYAGVNQDFGQTRTPVSGSSDTSWFSQQFTGLGPSCGVDVARRLGPHLAAYGTLRGALLFGNALRLTGTTLGFEAEERQETVLPNAEFQTGLEWRSTLRRGARLFLRAGIEAQVWTGIDNMSGFSDFYGAVVEQGTLGFFGFTSAVGLRF